MYEQSISKSKRQVKNPEASSQTLQQEKEKIFEDYYDWDNQNDLENDSDTKSTDCNFNGNHIKYYGTSYAARKMDFREQKFRHYAIKFQQKQGGLNKHGKLVYDPEDWLYTTLPNEVIRMILCYLTPTDMRTKIAFFS